MNFDVDLFVIGAGSGGVRAARFAAGFGARVAVAESRYLGGTCVNVGCVPKKLLVYGAQFAEHFETAQAFGWQHGELKFDWAALINHKNTEIARLNGIYRKLLESSDVQIEDGHARLLDANTVEVNGRQWRARHILLATGGWPQIPEIPGREHIISSNEAFFLSALPRRVLIIGGGYIAVEFATIFHGMGAHVTQLYRGEQILRGFDDGLRSHLSEEFLRKGIDLRTHAQLTRVERLDDGSLRATLNDGRQLEVDCVFAATGRRPMTDNLGLENTAVTRDKHGFVQVNEQYLTADPSISAIGDLINRMPLTPVALAEGMAVARRLFKPEQARAVDYHLIPTAVFSLPNIGTVGLTEAQAREAGYRLDIYESRFRPMRLTLTQNQERVFMKLIVDADTDRVLGFHMVGEDAGEIVQGIAVALKAGATKRIFDETIGVHPTAAEEFVTMRTVSRH